MTSPQKTDTDVAARRNLGALTLLVFLLMALAIGAAALILNLLTLQQPLQATRSAQLQTQAAQLQHSIESRSATAEHFAAALAALALSNWGDERAVRRLGQSVLEQLPANSAVVAAGIWSEPGRFTARRPRQSFYWTVSDDTSQTPTVREHQDYDDPDNISYHGEIWYQPTLRREAPGCFWTPRYTEPFLRRGVISCALPLRRNGELLGVASLVLDPQKIVSWTPDSWLMQSTGSPRYGLLLDQDQQLLSASGLDFKPGDNLAALAPQDENLGRLAVTLHTQNDARIQAQRKNQDDWDEQVAALVQSSRGLSRLQAEALLTRAVGTADAPPPRAQQLESSTGNVRSLALAGFGTLIIGESPPPRLAGMPADLLFSALSTAGALSLGLLLAWWFSRRTTIRPLHRILDQLALPPDDTIIDVRAHNEFSELAAQINARHERLRKLGMQQRLSPAGAAREVASAKPADTEDSQAELLDALPGSVVVTDTAGLVIDLNATALALLGQSRQQARGRNFDELFHLFDQRGKNRLTDLAKRAAAMGRRSERPLQAMLKTRSGQDLHVAISSAPTRNLAEDITGSLLILEDARNHSAPVSTRPVNNSDPLTGLLNRQAFDVDLAQRCEASRLGGEPPFSLLYLDVDAMHAINDRFGTEGGDEFLRQLSRLIQSDVGNGNPVYRLHGDRFAVILNTDDAAEAQVTCELLRADILSWGFQFKGKNQDVSASGSLIRVDERSGRAVDVLRLADELSEKAKTEGRGKIVTGQARSKRTERRDEKAWLKQIKRGLNEDRLHLSTQQLKALQRKADAGECFDTLLLLEDDEGFWNGAEIFMPVAERHELAAQLDQWMIEHIFRKLHDDRSLLDQIECCLISLSASSMQEPSFLDFVIEQFRDHQIPPAKVCFDLNERDVHSRLSTARDFCRTLKQAGCQMSLSGVTTRPSSYSLIKELPVDLVRFDTMMTRNAARDQADRLATESLHRIVQSLERKSAVVQIDSPELLRIVQGIGIDYAQGDAVARTTPILFQAQV